MVSNYTTLDFLDDFLNDLTLVFQILTLLLNIILVFWLIHVIYSIHASVTRWLRLRYRQGLECSDASSRKILFYKECIIRYIIFFFLLLFEIGYFVDYNLENLITSFTPAPDFDVHLGHNCTIVEDTILNQFFDTQPTKLFETFLASHFRSLITSSSWMYAVLLLHLTKAAKGELLRMKNLAKWLSFGIFQHLCFFIFCWFRWTTFFALLSEPFISQFNIIVAAVLARRFLRAMESRLNTAYHTWNLSSVREQKSLLRQYKILIPFSLGIIEIFYLKNMFLYVPYVIVETVLFNSCLYYLPKLNLSENTVNGYNLYSIVVFLLIRIIDAIYYSGLIVLNSVMICKFVYSKCKRVSYRYHVEDTLVYPLLN